VTPELLSWLLGKFGEMIVVGREFGRFRFDRTCLLGLVAHLFFVLPTGLFLGFGHFFNIQQGVPAENTGNGKDGPFNGVEIAQRIAVGRSGNLPPRSGEAAGDPTNKGEMEQDCSW